MVDCNSARQAARDKHDKFQDLLKPPVFNQICMYMNLYQTSGGVQEHLDNAVDVIKGYTFSTEQAYELLKLAFSDIIGLGPDNAW